MREKRRKQETRSLSRKKARKIEKRGRTMQRTGVEDWLVILQESKKRCPGFPMA